MTNPTLIARDGAMPSLLARHPWVLATSLQKTLTPIPKDSVVDIVDQRQKFIGRGLFNPDSRIAVRVYCWNQDEEIDTAMFRDRIDQAIALRNWPAANETLAGLDGKGAAAASDRGEPAWEMSAKGYTARRLVFSEADRLSGLIVEAYGP